MSLWHVFQKTPQGFVPIAAVKAKDAHAALTEAKTTFDRNRLLEGSYMVAKDPKIIKVSNETKVRISEAKDMQHGE